MSEHRLPVEIERLEEGGYLAICPAIQGCHAEGATIGTALDNLQDVARVIYELCQEKGLIFVEGAPHASPETVILEVALPLEVAA
ncbi:MAG: type II toxin-antitoxin system HicB family antitoxin [Deltaproteobacteria bacterium]|nr:type II toxin-antitoxin system HicB family antitoxin [Deltaproteobacteria bacterium]